MNLAIKVKADLALLLSFQLFYTHFHYLIWIGFIEISFIITLIYTKNR